MKLTVNDLLWKEFMWKKELVQLKKNGQLSEIKRLEFHYEAIDEEWEVEWFEPTICMELEKPYLLIHCKNDDDYEEE